MMTTSGGISQLLVAAESFLLRVPRPGGFLQFDLTSLKKFLTLVII